jgi:hypothetical protein
LQVGPLTKFFQATKENTQEKIIFKEKNIMGISWNFNSADYEENNFSIIPAGDHRVRIASVEPKTSSKGNDMLEIKLDVSGHSSSIWYYLVFFTDNPKMTNQKLGQIFDSFGIPMGNMNFASWVGKVGGARVKHEKYNGEDSAKVSYFLSRSKVDKLPAWQDSAGKASVTGGTPVIPDLDDELSL